MTEIYDPKLFVEGYSSAYTILGVPGRFVHSGYETTFKDHTRFHADAGAFLHTGYEAEFKIGYHIGADSGVFVHTGYDADFVFSYFITGEAGSFIHTGYDANFLLFSKINAETGIFNHTGHDATFVFGSAGSGILLSGDMQSGQDRLLLSGDMAPGILEISYYSGTITADSGSFTHTGHDAEFRDTIPLNLSGDMQSGSDELLLSGDMAPGSLLVSNG